MLVAADLAMSGLVTIHVLVPEILVKVAVPWLGIMPLISVMAPVYALVAVLFGSV